LLEQIVRQGQGGCEHLSAGGCAILWKFGSGFENPVGLGEQVFQGAEFGMVRWHDLTIGRARTKSNR
jgi:hypothetical protein